MATQLPTAKPRVSRATFARRYAAMCAARAITLEAGSGGGGSPPEPTFRILTEDGQVITTETGTPIRKEEDT